MKLWTKKLYNIKNSEGITEQHFLEYHLTFKSKNQLYLLMITEEYYHKEISHAEVIFHIK